MNCQLCKATEQHAHYMPIYRMIENKPEQRYYATVRGINYADATGYAMVNTELSQAFIPVYMLSPTQPIWVQDGYGKPLTPEQFQALYRNEEATA